MIEINENKMNLLSTSRSLTPSSPIMVIFGNWRVNDATIHLWADLSASVCKSSFP